MATVLERPVAAACDQLRAEQRAPNRASNTWEPNGRNMVRQYHGHQMMVEPLMVDGKCMGWFKWLDKHYRGIENGIASAELDLEREAESVCSAWAKRKAWEAVGAPERRQAR